MIGVGLRKRRFDTVWSSLAVRDVVVVVLDRHGVIQQRQTYIYIPSGAALPGGIVFGLGRDGCNG